MEEELKLKQRQLESALARVSPFPLLPSPPKRTIYIGEAF